MTRALIAAVLGIAALLVSSIGVIWFVTSDGGPGPSLGTRPTTPLAAAANDRPTAFAAPAATAAALSSEDAVVPGSEVAPEAVEDLGPPAELTVSRPPSRSGQDALTPESHRARISFRGQLTAGIAEIQKRVSGCARSDAAFKLDLETVANGIRVLDVQPEPGVSTDDDVACARAALMGEVIPAPDAEPGRRWQMPLSVRASR